MHDKIWKIIQTQMNIALKEKEEINTSNFIHKEIERALNLF